MKIKSIELTGYKRFALNDIKRFKMVPTERNQLILGTNGSGKSSLMAELSPLPAVAANYTKDGSKAIEIVHRGQEFLLTTHFASGHVHSFLRNQEELNPGGTLTVQRELVKQHFNVRQEVHDMITGVEKFSEMSPSRRREWFTELCDTSYDYALSVYARTKDTTRDINGALKLAKKRLVTETAMIVSEEDVKKIQEQIAQLVAEIDMLYQARTEQNESMQQLIEKQEDEEKKCLKIAKDVLASQNAANRLLDPAVIREQITSIREEIVAANTKIELLVKEHKELKETHDACLKTGAQGREELEKRLTGLRKQRDETLAERRLGLEFADPASSASALENMWPNLQLTFSEIPANADRRFSSAKLKELGDKRLAIQDKVQKICDNLEKLRHQKHHLDEIQKGEQTECPKCKHKWMPGYSPSVYAKILEVIEDLVKQHEEQKTELTKVTEEISAQHAYGDLMREYITMSRMSKDYLQPFWDLLNGEELIYNAPRSIEKRMEQLKFDLSKDIAAKTIEAEILKVQDLIIVAARTSDVDVSKVATRLESVEEALGMFSSSLRALNQKQQQSNQALEKVTTLIQHGSAVERWEQELNNGVTKIIKALRNEIITEVLHTLQIELAQKQKVLNDIEKQQAVVNDIAEQVKNLERQEYVHKLLVSALSPTDGLIAEGLLGFIRTFIRKMNVIIRKIWTYRLEVQDCATDGDDGAELDYRFPVLVNNEATMVADVKLGSTGIKEVINLAFKIVATHYLDLSEGALFLDEFAVSLDTEHRVAASRAIKQILEQLPFSQVFMISHYEAHHGSFTNAEVCVLNKQNIVVPTVYNQHVEMS